MWAYIFLIVVCFDCNLILCIQKTWNESYKSQLSSFSAGACTIFTMYLFSILCYLNSSCFYLYVSWHVFTLIDSHTCTERTSIYDITRTLLSFSIAVNYEVLIWYLIIASSFLFGLETVDLHGEGAWKWSTTIVCASGTQDIIMKRIDFINCLYQWVQCLAICHIIIIDKLQNLTISTRKKKSQVHNNRNHSGLSNLTIFVKCVCRSDSKCVLIINVLS